MYDIKFSKLLFIGILKTHFIDHIVKKYKIKYIVSTQMSFTSYGNLVSRYGTKFKIKTLQLHINLFKSLKIIRNFNKSVQNQKKKLIII